MGVESVFQSPVLIGIILIIYSYIHHSPREGQQYVSGSRTILLPSITKYHFPHHTHPFTSWDDQNPSTSADVTPSKHTHPICCLLPLHICFQTMLP